MTRRVLLSYISLALFVLILLEIPLAVFFADRERERFAGGVSSDAAVLATLYEDALEIGTAVDPVPAGDYATSTGARVVVVDAGGISVADTDTGEPRDFSTRPEIIEALAGLPNQGTRRSETLDAELLYVAVPIASGGVIHGALRITLPISDVNARVHRFWAGLVAVGGVVLAAVALIGWRLARSITRPVRQLGDMATAFGSGQLDPQPVPPRAPEEIRQLGHALNTMAGRLGRQLEAQRAFVADASHQLRTPLTALRLRLENLDEGLDGADHDQLAAALDEIQRLSDLVEQLLRLARADGDLWTEPTDLVALVADRVDTWQAVAQAANVALEADLPTTEIVLSVSPGALEQVLDNLIDNAVGLSPPDSAVTVRVVATGGSVALEVRDRGPGLSDADKQRALTRFWRKESDRPGSGLGLPIAASLVAAHAGSLDLLDPPGGGLLVRVTLPGPAGGSVHSVQGR